MAKTTKTAWIKAKTHEITLPSGTEIEIEIPNLPAMLKAGQIPNPLIELAVTTANSPDKKVTTEDIKAQAEYYGWLVSTAVVAPAVTADDVAELPFEDIEMIVQIATRDRDMDAVYNHIGGLEKVESFRRFRGLTTGDEGVVG